MSLSSARQFVEERITIGYQIAPGTRHWTHWWFRSRRDRELSWWHNRNDEVVRRLLHDEAESHYPSSLSDRSPDAITSWSEWLELYEDDWARCMRGLWSVRDAILVRERRSEFLRMAHSPTDPIFVVHGHDLATARDVARALERVTRRDVVILHEQANRGATIIEKFEEHATNAAFAVIVLTADDLGRAKSSRDERPRGRQNVIFEMGFFFGHLGRRRVMVLLDPDVEEPSDVQGIVYEPLDAAGRWKTALLRELSIAGIDADASRMP